MVAVGVVVVVVVAAVVVAVVVVVVSLSAASLSWLEELASVSFGRFLLPFGRPRLRLIGSTTSTATAVTTTAAPELVSDGVDRGRRSA